jgi:hypothetical protein
MDYQVRRHHVIRHSEKSTEKRLFRCRPDAGTLLAKSDGQLLLWIFPKAALFAELPDESS